MVQNVVKEDAEVEAAEPVESIPTSEVEKATEIAGLDWSPLSNDKLEAHAEEILSGIFERIPGLSVRTSKNQHQAIRYGEGRGRVVAKIWFAKTKVCVETPVLEGRKYVVGKSRYLNDKNGLNRKDRSAVVKEINTFIAARGWS